MFASFRGRRCAGNEFKLKRKSAARAAVGLGLLGSLLAQQREKPRMKSGVHLDGIEACEKRRAIGNR